MAVLGSPHYHSMPIIEKQKFDSFGWLAKAFAICAATDLFALRQSESNMLFVERYLVSNALGRSLDVFCQSLAIDLRDHAEALNIDIKQFQNPENYICLSKFSHILEHLSEVQNSTTFGLMYALNYNISQLGPFGFAIQNAPSLDHALKFYCRFAGLLADHANLSLDVEEKNVSLKWNFSPFVNPQSQFCDFVSLLAIKQIRGFVGKSWSPSIVYIDRPRPSEVEVYSKHLAVRVVFSAEQCAIVLPREHLALQNATADHRIFELMELQCEQELRLKINSRSVDARVKEEILNRFTDGSFTLVEIAKSLSMSERNLQRRLSEVGTTYEALLEATRRELSDFLLKNKRLALAEISFLLGYSSPNAYSRAAKNWYDIPPSRVRELQISSTHLDANAR
jgi:AraC-like DNA-binding protein